VRDGEQGRAARLAAWARSAARRPVLRGVTSVGDLTLAAAVTIAAVVTAALGLLYVQHTPTPLVLPDGFHLPPPPARHLQLLPIWSLALIGVVAATAPLALRRTYPTTAFGVILAAFIATKSYSTGITVGAAIFAAYCAVAYSKYRRTTLLCLLAAAVVITVVYPQASAQVPERYTPLLVLLPTAAMGNMMRMWRKRAADSAERLHLAEAAHEEETRRAVETERARIARELHDVVTHNVSVMVVQAGAARRVLEGPPGGTAADPKARADPPMLPVRQALLAVEASGRTAMTELRHLLGLLAPAGEADSAGPDVTSTGLTSGLTGTALASTGPDELRPQPGLDQVPALIERVRTAGLKAELSVTGTSRALPPGLELAAYRVVQEALTNVIKHAGSARTVVRVDYRPHELRITVSDNGRPPGNARVPRQPPDPGRGLLGLRERIAIYGGELDAGPRPGGGWLVSARVRLDPVLSEQEPGRAAAARA
jgi:signal transduction histidine kinase